MCIINKKLFWCAGFMVTRFVWNCRSHYLHCGEKPYHQPNHSYYYWILLLDFFLQWDFVVVVVVVTITVISDSVHSDESIHDEQLEYSSLTPSWRAEWGELGWQLPVFPGGWMSSTGLKYYLIDLWCNQINDKIRTLLKNHMWKKQPNFFLFNKSYCSAVEVKTVIIILDCRCFNIIYNLI